MERLFEGGARRSRGRRGSRLGNVAGALLWERCSRPTETARLLDGLFEEVLRVGGEPSIEAPGRWLPQPVDPDHGLRALVSLLAEAEAERVVVVAADRAGPTADLLLGLTAWPGADVVVAGDAPGDVSPPCAIYRRGVCLEAARARIAEGGQALQDLFESVETKRISRAQLGIAPGDAELRAHSQTPDDLAGLEGR